MSPGLGIPQNLLIHNNRHNHKNQKFETFTQFQAFFKKISIIYLNFLLFLLIIYFHSIKLIKIDFIVLNRFSHSLQKRHIQDIKDWSNLYYIN